jgi:hypothetical protein
MVISKMILERGRTTTAWSPHRFEQYRTHYPETPWNGPAGHDRTGRFLWHWDEPQSAASLPKSAAIVLTPGLFSEWLPGCFASTARAFRRDGHRVLRSSVRTSRSTDEQARALRSEITRWLGPGERFLWLAHSKGVLDALWCLRNDPSLAARCLGLVAMQPPSGISWVLQSWITAPSTFAERAARQLVSLGMFRAGCREITRERDPALNSWLDAFISPVPMVQAVSWSVEPTSWVDSFHTRLNKLRPGCAHDGQLYLPDQILPSTPTVCLPRLDHAQPVLGGFGLDVGRLWRTLALVVLDESASHTR